MRQKIEQPIQECKIALHYSILEIAYMNCVFFFQVYKYGISVYYFTVLANHSKHVFTRCFLFKFEINHFSKENRTFNRYLLQVTVIC